MRTRTIAPLIVFAWSDSNLEGDWRVAYKADWKQVVSTLVERVWRRVRGHRPRLPHAEMRTSRARGVTLAVGLVLGASVPAATAETVMILRVGSFHQDEVSVSNAGVWLALMLDGNGSRLESTNVVIDLEHDPIVDKPEEKTGRKVSAFTSTEPLVLLRAKGLRPGPVQTELAQARAIPANEVVPVAGYSLRTACRETEVVAGQRQYRCALLVREADRRQEIAAFRAYGEADAITFVSEREPLILWAGDLDRDGRTDLLVDTSDHYNESAITLYLSSAAGPDEILRAVARFRGVGC